MAVVAIPIDASSGTPTFTSQQTRQAWSALFSAPTAARPLGARSGVRAGTSTATVVLSGAGSTTWTVAAHSGVLDTESPVAAGPYLYACDGTDTGTTTAADASNPRIDVIWVAINDTVQDGSGLRNGVVGYTAGVAAGSPVVPSPSNARGMVLGQVNVPKVGTGSPTVTWVAPYTAAAGGFVTIRSSTERTAMSPYDTQGIHRSDLNCVEVYNGTTWDRYYPENYLRTFGGSALIGTYDATKPVLDYVARKTGISDGSGMATTTAMPAGTTAILAVDLGMNLVTGHTILFRTDLSSASSAVFQLRNSASPYATLTATAYDFNHTIHYQI